VARVAGAACTAVATVVVFLLAVYSSFFSEYWECDAVGAHHNSARCGGDLSVGSMAAQLVWAYPNANIHTAGNGYGIIHCSTCSERTESERIASGFRA
ncbi:MAG: hypothetical protein ACRC43_07455, partial [Plesiomonas shigelloides]